MSIFEQTSINRQSENTQEQISAHRTDMWALWKSSKRAKTQSRQRIERGERKGWEGGCQTELRQPQKYTSLNPD